jgi:hypothetical protein
MRSECFWPRPNDMMYRCACRRPTPTASAARDYGHRRSDDRFSSPPPKSATTARACRAIATAGADVESHLSRIAVKRPFVLAHMNHARLIAPMDDPRIVEFAHAMGPINEIANSTRGFVWSLDDNDDDARRQRDDVECLSEDPLLFPQLSLWHDVDSIKHFVYKSGHAMYYRRRKEWFAPHPEGSTYSVCWWHRLTLTNGGRGARPPTLLEAFGRCEHLHSNGPTAYAFDFATYANFPMPSSS